MKKIGNKWAFTLIELLVVITIMGILATGAVNVFTTQLQKARDSTRISDINALRNAIEQFYQDTSNYPEKTTTFADTNDWIGGYLQWWAPSDPRTGNSSANSVFDYLYNVSPDRNTIPLQEYEVSTHFENDGNITNRAAADNWDDGSRLEVWIDLNDTDWTHSKKTVAQIDGWIDGAVVSFSCITADWASGDCTNADEPLLVR